MKIKDITEEVNEARRRNCHPCDGPWSDDIGWKSIRNDGFDAVRFDGEVWSFGKWGPIERLPDVA